MRKINITNENKRDAQVGFEGQLPKNTVRQVLPGDRQRQNVRILKTTLETDIDQLLANHDADPDKLAEALIAGDPEVDIEKTGQYIPQTRKLYVDHNNRIVYSIATEEIVFAADGTEKERRPYEQADANIATDKPLRWSGKMIPKTKAINMFVFSRKYQVRHVSGLTYDFLYDMAKKLHEANSMMLIGGGEKGVSPLVFSSGGVSYRGFLEGRIQDEKYCLLLHLSNLELKEIPQ